MHAPPSPRRSTRPARSLWLALLCALSLLGLQGLGQWHGIAHAVKAGTFSTAGGVATVASSDFWGHAIGDADCHVFDHLSHDDWLAAAQAVSCDKLIDRAPAAPALAGADLAARFKRGARGPPPIS